MPSSRKRSTKKRKQRARAAGAAPQGDFSERYRARSEAKNVAAREGLEPLDDGERPGSVTVAAVVAGVLAASNVAFYVAGVEIRNERPPIAGFAVYTLLMGAMAYGLWRARYWAVLGMEALLALLIIVFAVLLVAADNALAVLVSVAMIGSAGTLFWFLVKALARIQMPVRQ